MSPSKRGLILQDEGRLPAATGSGGGAPGRSACRSGPGRPGGLPGSPCLGSAATPAAAEGTTCLGYVGVDSAQLPAPTPDAACRHVASATPSCCHSLRMSLLGVGLLCVLRLQACKHFSFPLVRAGRAQGLQWHGRGRGLVPCRVPAHPGRRRCGQALPAHLRIVALLGRMDQAVQEQHLPLRKALRCSQALSCGRILCTGTALCSCVAQAAPCLESV